MNQSCSDFRAATRLSRRSLLKAGALGCSSLALPALLKAETSGLKPKAKHIIFLHQWGGPSHIDTFDMKPDAPDGIRGEFAPIASNTPGIRLTEHLPEFAKVLGRFAQVRSVHHTMKNHNSAGYYSLTGHAPPLDDQRLRDTPDLFPAYGSTVAKLKPSDDPAIPSFVTFPHVIRDGSVTPGQAASFLGKPYDPFFIGQDPSKADFRLPELTLPATLPLDRLDDRRGLLNLIDGQTALLESSTTAQGIDEFYSRALTMLASPKVTQAFDLSHEPKTLRDAYGRNTYGQSCLLARRLVEAGVRFVTVYFSASIGSGAAMTGGWDTHGNNFNALKNRLLPMTDLAVPTLINDLDSRGLLDDTLVVWMGEFGRTPKVSSSEQFGADGRNHWPQCYTALFAGGGVTPGAIYGASDRIGAYPSLDPVRPDDLAATMFWALGLDPSTEVLDTLGRPFPIAAGKPITSIFS